MFKFEKQRLDTSLVAILTKLNFGQIPKKTMSTQISQAHVGPLTNTEVFEIIRKQKQWHEDEEKKYQEKMSKSHRLFPTTWIANKLYNYLKRDTISGTSQQTIDDINKLLNEINQFDTNNQLTRIEKLQIINLLPCSEPVLYSIISQLHKKFKQHDVDKLLQIISKYRREEDEDEDDDDDDDDDEEDEDEDD